MAILCRELSIGYGEKRVLSDVNLRIPAGRLTTLIGANGCGKSTLLRHIARLEKPIAGGIELEGKPLQSYSNQHFAHKLAMLPQSPTTFADMTVFDVVKLGRFPHQSFFQQWSKEDEMVVEQVLQLTGLDKMAGQIMSKLSGGQRQRAWIALTLAQQSQIILLDEPINHLDLHHQIEILDLVSQLQQEQGKTILLVLHDINLACRYSHYLVALAEGGVYREGNPADIVDETLLNDVFGIRSQVLVDPVYQTPLCLPLGQYFAKYPEVVD